MVRWNSLVSLLVMEFTSGTAGVECKKLSGMLFVECLVRFRSVDNDAIGRGAVQLCGHSVDKRNN